MVAMETDFRLKNIVHYLHTSYFTIWPKFERNLSRTLEDIDNNYKKLDFHPKMVAMETDFRVKNSLQNFLTPYPTTWTKFQGNPSKTLEDIDNN